MYGKHYRRLSSRRARSRSHRRSLRANPKMNAGALLGLIVVGGVAAWLFSGSSKPKRRREWETAGVLPPGTGEVIYVPTATGKTVPASKQVAVPKEAPMPDWLKAALAAGALVPGLMPGTLIINAGYNWLTSTAPWWQKAAVSAGFLIPGSGTGTLLMNAVYDWWNS